MQVKNVKMWGKRARERFIRCIWMMISRWKERASVRDLYVFVPSVCTEELDTSQSPARSNSKTKVEQAYLRNTDGVVRTNGSLGIVIRSFDAYFLSFFVEE